MSYTCPSCRTFVPDGVVHNCPYYFPQSTQTYTIVDYGALYGRIALALERIANALEARNPQPVVLKKAVKRRG